MLTRRIPSSTHTLEMSQLAQLNDRLTPEVGALEVAAGELGVAQVPLLSDPAGTLPANAAAASPPAQGDDSDDRSG
jgi:hypothetical protein